MVYIGIMSDVTVMDVREDLRAGRHPLPQIMGAVAGLPPNGRLRVIAIFEPIPLIHLLRSRGVGHKSKQVGPEHWEIEFGRDLPIDGPVSSGGAMPACGAAAGMVDVDARGLEPPEPMMRILTAVENLPAGGTVRALTDRRPMHLLDALAERGYIAESHETPAGGWETLIRKSCGAGA